MKLKLKKYYYLISAAVIAITMVSTYQVNANYSLYQESATSSSGQFSIPSCTTCDASSEPTCSGFQSPLCSVDQSIPTCQLTGNFCNPACPSANIAGGNSPFCSTKYFFVDGPGAGIQIYSGSDNTFKISFNTNSTTFANGTIKKPDEKCPGPNSHFNGDILNFSDSEPNGCGWGHVVIFKKLPERLSLLSDIITTTEHASYNIQAFVSGDYGAALTRVTSSLDNLEKFRNLITKSKDIKSKNKKVIMRRIKTAVKEGQIAKLNISSIVDAKNTGTADIDPLKRDAAITALSNTHDNEVEILKVLLKFDTVQ